MKPIVKKALLLPVLLLSGLCSEQASAQSQGRVYLQYTNIKVNAGADKVLAWCGGMNNPQPNLADLNKDGKMDLVIYEKDYGIKTFINKGNAGSTDYEYDPYYQMNFPPAMQDYVKLVDYDRDGIMDLFHRGAPGFVAYKGYYNSRNELCFSYYRDLYYKTQFSGMINVYCEPTDIPAIVDIDGDGDLDFLAYYINGGYINFYRNCQEEDGLPKDSIRICLKDNCWGKAYQASFRAQFLAQSCSSLGTTCKGCGNDNSAEKTTHTGNALCIFDYDKDGDMDYMTGGVSFDDIQLVLNGRTQLSYPVDTMTSQDTSWSYGGKKVQLNLWPAPFYIDIDNDLQSDLLFSPHMVGTENYKTITFFKNKGGTPPVWEYQTDEFLTDRMIDIGTGSYPMLYDYNKDGLKDLFIGSEGFFTGGNTLVPRMAYYKNTGTANDPKYTLENPNFLIMNVAGFEGAAPAVGDINNDGKDDLVVGHKDGTLTVYLNTAATQNDQPVWVKQTDKLKDNGNITVMVDNYAAPFFYDLNKDGRKDLIIGCQQGTLWYYSNQSTTPGQISMKKETNKLGDIKVDDDLAYGHSVPYIGRIDNTSTDYLVIGSNSGALYRYDGFQSGNATTPYTMLDSMYSEIKTDGRSAPTFTDFEGDNRYEMISGNIFGGVTLYRQLFNVNIDGTIALKSEVKVFPNPAKDRLYVNWETGFTTADEVSIVLTSVMGQKLLTQTVAARDMGAKVELGNLPNGIYYCTVLSGSKKVVNTVTIVK
jgi:hypothetical protein